LFHGATELVDVAIKKYADSIYQKTLFESAQTARQDTTKYLQERARTQGSGQLFSGIEYQGLVKIYVSHIDRCTAARLDSYQRAFNEVDQTPSEADLNEVLDDFKLIWEVQIKHSAHSLANFGAARNAPKGLNPSSDLRAQSAYGHDRALQDWMIWRDRVRLHRSKADPEHDGRASVSEPEAKPTPAIVREPKYKRGVSIWSHFFGWDVLFGWNMIGWTEAILITGILALIAIGYAVPVNVNDRWFVTAQMCLAVAAMLFLVKIIEIAVITSHPFWERAIFTVALFGAVGLLTAEGIRGINSIRPLPKATNLVVPVPAQSPNTKTTTPHSDQEAVPKHDSSR
jgi:hypothetical protein